MPSNVITARLYTGNVYYLGRAQSGKLGEWCVELARAECVPTEGDATYLFDALCSHLEHKSGRTLFDPALMALLQLKACLVELGAARVLPDKVEVFRRKIMDTKTLDGRFSNSSVLKLSELM